MIALLLAHAAAALVAPTLVRRLGRRAFLLLALPPAAAAAWALVSTAAIHRPGIFICASYAKGASSGTPVFHYFESLG